MFSVICAFYLFVYVYQLQRQRTEWITHFNTQCRITDGPVRPYSLCLIYIFIPFNPHFLFYLFPSPIPSSILTSLAGVLWFVYMPVKHELFYVHCYFLIFINGNINYIFTCFSHFHKILCLYDYQFCCSKLAWFSLVVCMYLPCLSIYSINNGHPDHVQLPATNLHKFPYIFPLTDLTDLLLIEAREGYPDGRISIYLI